MHKDHILEVVLVVIVHENHALLGSSKSIGLYLIFQEYWLGDTDSIKTTINKILRLCQGDRPTSTYATDSHLLATDIPWDDQALMEQFCYVLRNDVKDLLLTFPEEPKSLIEAISRAVRCDNHLFEQCSKCQFQMPRTRSEPTYTSVVAKPFPRESYNASPANTPTPMEIDTTRCHGPLSEKKKQ